MLIRCNGNEDGTQMTMASEHLWGSLPHMLLVAVIEKTECAQVFLYMTCDAGHRKAAIYDRPHTRYAGSVFFHQWPPLIVRIVYAV